MVPKALVVIVALSVCGTAPAARAQTSRPSTRIESSPEWSLDTSQPQPSRRTKGRSASRGVTSPPDLARVTHDAELRKQFFDRQAKAAVPKPVPIPEFGGYDAATKSGDGTFKPGATFKF